MPKPRPDWCSGLARCAAQGKRRRSRRHVSRSTTVRRTGFCASKGQFQHGALAERLQQHKRHHVGAGATLPRSVACGMMVQKKRTITFFVRCPLSRTCDSHPLESTPDPNIFARQVRMRQDGTSCRAEFGDIPLRARS
eukprot:2714906-Pyramimonas_sp.AAC.2